ncbi:unnamed protein product [Clavelina lepadiformis]|uniref:Uncharacterized protein n=1 Tax=Clavelina lepadiformis TaxID=159417 RepID=A0ABP0EWV1_CLALP
MAMMKLLVLLYSLFFVCFCLSVAEIDDEGIGLEIDVDTEPGTLLHDGSRDNLIDDGAEASQEEIDDDRDSTIITIYEETRSDNVKVIYCRPYCAYRRQSLFVLVCGETAEPLECLICRYGFSCRFGAVASIL